MNFDLSEDQLTVRAAIEKVCAPFGDDYWPDRDKTGDCPHDFHQAMRKELQTPADG